ncbi:hypothetical protein [Streptacidiphilus sp. P02-A3a]|uniref:hypothetical protein n=1 Tax=Streptacidiphilus sp. P02-A3a TaxID=2704468 RepID=UPI0015FDE3C2|nr:hypothetical protein [Streptacidiphilus sp. P02-A3a]QMU67069.1 hypothetical protein GXP74_01425 [Streptacidiphilus sp. P02-A3a]
MMFEAGSGDDTRQIQFDYRPGTTGAWRPMPLKWTQISSNPSFPLYDGSFYFDGGAVLGLAPHGTRTFQMLARRVATSAETQPFDADLTAGLTPDLHADQDGNLTARADISVAPLGLSTEISGLPTNIPADGKPLRLTVAQAPCSSAGPQPGAGTQRVRAVQRCGPSGL